LLYGVKRLKWDGYSRTWRSQRERNSLDKSIDMTAEGKCYFVSFS
jgi:hypothetical protein